MIYVISKDTFGSYDVRDIQCNANWDCCPYSEYALIPESMVDEILATQGYCDITLNDSGTEVLSYTARSIPTVQEECCGTNTVLSVNGVTANTDGAVTLTPNDIDAAPAGYGLGEDNGRYCDDCNTALRPGFYYISDGNCANTPVGYDRWKWAVMLVQRRGLDVFQTIMFNGVSATRMISLDVNTGAFKSAGAWAYITPPLNDGVEYLTTEKFNGNNVYAHKINFGKGTTRAVDITTDTIESLVRVEGCWVNGDIQELFTSDYIVSGVSVDRYYGASRLKVEVNSVGSNYTGYPVVYYTKKG